MYGNVSITYNIYNFNFRLVESILDCEACQVQPNDLDPEMTLGHVVDLRREQALLRNIQYLSRKFDLTFYKKSNSIKLYLVGNRAVWIAEFPISLRSIVSECQGLLILSEIAKDC